MNKHGMNMLQTDYRDAERKSGNSSKFDSYDIGFVAITVLQGCIWAQD